MPSILTFGLSDSPDTWGAQGGLAYAGGKGANLLRLSAAGFPVPPGLVIGTPAYAEFVAQNHLDAVIAMALRHVRGGEHASLEPAGFLIRQAFEGGLFPADLRIELTAALRPFIAAGAVAVRSSATAEDLPDLSFAGQQDTYLNVVGLDAVIAAVISCWGSLWTARAIGYRTRAGIDHAGTGIAVIVQTMVAAEASGVLFTANPLTGARGETVIDATFGLGEALVSGQVEPDHFVVDTASGRVLDRTRGAKAMVTRALRGGGVETASVVAAAPAWSVTDDQVSRLTRIGDRVAAEFGAPQDLEWAVADGSIHLLQARPITSLYPLPEVPDDGSLPAWLSFGSVQGILDPITPIGQDALALLLRGLYRTFGVEPPAVPALDGLGVLRVAGERLWIRVDRALTHPIGATVMPVFLGIGDPAFQAILGRLDEPRLRPAPGAWPRVTGGVAKLARFFFKVLPALPVAALRPADVRLRLDAECASLVANARRSEAEASRAGAPGSRLDARLAAMQTSLEAAFPVLLQRFAPIMVPTGLVTKLMSRYGPGSLEVFRSVDGNVTTDMDLALWDVAEIVRADADVCRTFVLEPTADVVARFRAGTLPAAVQLGIERFLARYGMRGVGEVDMGRARWSDEPAAVISTLQAYVGLSSTGTTPDVQFQQGRSAATAAMDRIAGELAHGGWVGRLKAHRDRFLVGRVRAMAGARETPKFTIVQVMGIIRGGLVASGADLVADGRLTRPDDVVFLHVADLRRAWTAPPGELQRLVAERRARFDRERQRRQIPRLLLGDGRTFYEGIGHDDEEGTLSGSPVSPGVVEGRVRVVLDPAAAGLQSGEVLVCAGTDPAWTPLFLTAGGLVTEVGGMMTHGSVVAREYGIPAVVGVHAATQRLVTGQLIRLDGSSGRISVLAAPEAAAG